MHKGKIHRRSVEYNLTEHCNLRCRGCGHASPLFPEKFASLATFREDLEALARFREPTQPLDIEPLGFAKLLSLALIEQKEGGAELTDSGRERLRRGRSR